MTQALRPKPKPKAPKAPKIIETKAEKKLRKRIEKAEKARAKVTSAEGKIKEMESGVAACGADKKVSNA